MFRHRTIIAEDMSSFKYEAKDNRAINKIALTRVFTKTGTFIFNLGLVNFCETAITTWFMAIWVFRVQQEIPADEQTFLDSHLLTILTFGYCLGSFISLSTIQSISMQYPWLPTSFQCLNFILWIWNLKVKFCTDIAWLFVWCMWIGVHAGTSYTNFLFLACTKTNMDCDMQLNYYERELVVNLLLMAFNLGPFLAGAFSFGHELFEYPEMLYNPPN